jgi:hypothetical protein
MAWASKQNPIQINPPPQLLLPCAWTVHPPKGRAGLCAVALGAGVGRSNPLIMDGGVWCGGRTAGFSLFQALEPARQIPWSESRSRTLCPLALHAAQTSDRNRVHSGAQV